MTDDKIISFAAYLIVFVGLGLWVNRKKWREKR